MHAERDYLSFPVCVKLAQRGYTVFCAQNGASKWMGASDVESMMLSVSEGVDYLRNMTEVDHIVLWGHSGGGAMMAAY
jgi:dipeptidyl aminopeptidase/acylaminoacyl peptidase